MTSKAQLEAIRRYESSGKRPGKKITIRLSDKEYERLKKLAGDQSLAAYIKSRL